MSPSPVLLCPDVGLVEQYRLAMDARRILGDLGWPLKLWTALRLVREEGVHFRDDLERLKTLRIEGPACFLGGLLADGIVRIRETLGRWSREVEEFVAEADPPLDPGCREIVVALLVCEPPVEISSDVLRDRERDARGLLQALNAPSLPDGVNPDLLEDLRHVRGLLAAAGRTSARVEVWEVFRLALEDRETLDRAADRLRKVDPEDALNVDLIRFCSRLRELRATDGERVRWLRGYVDQLPIGKYGADTMELTFGLILASPEGSLRVDQWMEDPAHHRREAAIRVEGVIGRAQKYIQALRCHPAA